jgi:hypothetical protein
MLKEAVSHWGWISFAVIALITAAVTTRPAFKQPSNMVVIRKPGHRWFGPPQPAQACAAEDLPYAWLSTAAYGSPTSTKAADSTKFQEGSAGLGDLWSRWTDFPDGDLQNEMTSVHLRAQVWEKQSEHLLVVTFGGTEATNLNDLKSNTHWAHPFLRDEYTVLGETFAPAFAKELARKMQQPGQEYLGQVHLRATGHSLGGGLAEKFAYSLPAAEYRIPRVEKVYAFDPSPVTTFVNTRGSVRKENKEGLKIDRIFERGEVLAIVRAITAVVHKPSAANPRVTQLRYNLFGDDRFGFTNPIASHSIEKLAARLKDVAAGIEGSAAASCHNP